jgi:hypothetical protein
MIRKSEILSNRFAYEHNEEILVNANDICELIISEEKLARKVAYLENKLEIMVLLAELKEDACIYRKIDLKA